MHCAITYRCENKLQTIVVHTDEQFFTQCQELIRYGHDFTVTPVRVLPKEQ